jgi:hypothetical protein
MRTVGVGLITLWRSLFCAGKVIPLRSIAYFEKYKIKKPYITFTMPLLMLTVIATAVAAANSSREPLFLVPLIAGLFIWLLGMIIIAAKRRKYVLILQTTAGDTPRLFETQDENFFRPPSRI